MSGPTNPLVAKEYADDFLFQKIYGVAAPSTGWTDYDPGVDGPTDPSPPDDNPTFNQIETYIKARHARTLWEIKTAVNA